jgi:hypothetical protein
MNNLFVKVRCSICFGTHNNHNKGNCPYCDVNGKTFIEVSIKTLIEELKNLSDLDKEEIIKSLRNNG